MTNRSMMRSAAAVAALVVAGLVMTSCGKAVPPGEGSMDGAAPISTQTSVTTTDSDATESAAPSTESSTESATESPTDSTPSSAPSDEPVATVPTYVYYVVDAHDGLRLSREIVDVSDGSAGVTDAVEAMIGGPADPDYMSTWNPATRVLSVDVDAPGELITVDLSGDARTANVGTAGAALMIHQLLWTVTEAAGLPDARVVLLIDGEPAGELWGAVEWIEPEGRVADMDVRALLQIDNPREGATVTSPVTVDGDALAFEANVLWRVLDAGGAEVQSGFTMTTDGVSFAPFSFEVELPPGEYTVEIVEDDPSDGAGGPPYVDSRHVTVTS